MQTEFSPEEMAKIIADLGLPGNAALYLLGDGSGNIADAPAGWCVYAYNRLAQTVTRLTGAVSHGTNNFAELMPYVHALWHYHVMRFGNQERGPASTPIPVYVVSDSEVTVRQGNGLYRRSCNSCFWDAISWFEKNNYSPLWRHVRRNTTPVHQACDLIAGQKRLAGH